MIKVYLLYNNITGKGYVGITSQEDIEDRIQEHARLRSDIGNALSEYGRDAFGYEVLRECFSRPEAQEWEKYYIQQYNTLKPYGYNEEK